MLRVFSITVVLIVTVMGQNFNGALPNTLSDVPDYEVLQFPTKPVANARDSKIVVKNSRIQIKDNVTEVQTVKPVIVQTPKPASVQTSKPVKQSVTTSKPVAAEQSGPCKCKQGQCSCCTGPILDFFSQKMCTRIVYYPEDFTFDFAMLLNNRVMYKNKLSGKNPPPACIGIPRTRIRMCAKFSNVYFAGRNMHLCMGMEGNWDSYQVFSYSFDCIRMGSNGFAVVKPEDGGGLPGGLDAVIDSGDDISDYDENVVRSVFEEFSKFVGV